jgi:IPT/TIG domain
MDQPRVWFGLVHVPLLDSAAHRRTVLMLAVLAASCGGSPAGPSGTPPRVVSITPATGSTLGGTAVTISGSGFSGGAMVSIGGSPATAIVVVSSSTITATTAPHASGSADVIVSVNGQSGTLARGFTYVQAAPNAPPVITGIIAKGTRPNEPAQFADLDEEIPITATVEDAETPVSQLEFAWTAPIGTVTGHGASITWRAPKSFSTPAATTITLVVTEHYQTVDDNGQPVTRDNTATASTTIQLHDSVGEVSGLARQFLIDFSDSSLSPAYVVRNFSSNCRGRDLELSDVENNRANFLILSSKIGQASTTVNFGGHCPFRDVAGDACAEVPVEWHSRVLADGTTRTDIGTDQVSAVYEGTAWKLCESDYRGNATSGLQFMR